MDEPVKADYIENAKETFRELKAFWAKYQRRDGTPGLPTWAELKLGRFVSTSTETYFHGSEAGWAGLGKRMGLLVGIKEEMDFLLEDREAVARSLASRAFAHLQRSIVADPTFAESWRAAFDAGELACEKLGAVQLLRFGISAFKVDAIGARTDLVYGTPVNLIEAERTSEALVLTEWKLVRNQSELDIKIAEAKAQAEHYTSGVLGSIEVSSLRYLVMVSQEVLAGVAKEFPGGGATYEVINIAVGPSSPSVLARRAAGAEQRSSPPRKRARRGSPSKASKRRS